MDEGIVDITNDRIHLADPIIILIDDMSPKRWRLPVEGK
jgi:hypothetical protein